jgi:S1-C subfamily serine protease
MKEELGIETLKQRIRPAMGGFSVGHYKITAGTIATCVYDVTPFPGIPSRYYILSNNHVLANSNNARIGDPILQPGPYDGGTVPGDVIARLFRFVPIKFKTPTSAPINYVDAAIAEGDFHNLNREIYWIGYVQQVNSIPKVGDIVEKTGRTTNFTTGKITAIDATVDVNYGGGLVARFGKQIITTAMSAGGDSGSLVCDIKEGAVGLLFAGSSSVTVANSILYVQSLLGIRLHP